MSDLRHDKLMDCSPGSGQPQARLSYSAFRLPPCGSISRQRDDARVLVRKAG
ncbi:MAG: hypothetical protein H6875_02030 [Hyphomicrobiaceae bacterium]|nr:hypothetical protein [Hyphomicrobiaceae bacterium]